MSLKNFHGTHIYGTPRGHLCDSTAFLFSFIGDALLPCCTKSFVSGTWIVSAVRLCRPG